jgi:L-xylulose reductase
MAEQNFQNKRVCVTGAGRGIGKSLALRLAQLGATVIAVSKSDENLKQLVAENNSITPVCVDLTDWNATKEAIKPHLPIQYLVNNAAMAILDPFLEAKPEDFDLLFNINVRSIICVSQEIARDLIERKLPGSIVNLSSQASEAALKDHSIYCSTKAAVDGLTRVMALELGPYQIRVNTVQPTVVLTDMGRIGWSEEKKAAGMLSKIPLNKFAEVEDVVEPIIFLLSDSSKMINGIGLPIDGGFLAT